MKEAEIQFISGRKIIVKDIIDYVESQDFDVIVTKDEEHITVFRNSVEYMIVKDIDEVIKDPDAVMKDPDDFHNYWDEFSITDFDKRPLCKEGKIRIPELILIEGKDIPKDAFPLDAVVYLKYRKPYELDDYSKTIPVLISIKKEEN